MDLYRSVLKIKKAARLFAKTDKAAIYFAMGITQHRTGTDNVLSVANLAMLTGNVGRESTGVNPLRGQNNVQGACDLGALSNVYPGYQSVEDPEIKEKFARAWGTEELSEEIGLTVVEIFKKAGKEIKGLYIIGENPVISDPDQRHIEAALESLDFLVVQDIFLTETAKYADLVLPAACFAEKEGTFTNTERRIQKVNQVIDVISDADDSVMDFHGILERTEFGKDELRVLLEKMKGNGDLIELGSGEFRVPK